MSELKITDQLWAQWQSRYAARRGDVFLRILEAKRRLTMKASVKHVTFLSNVRECVIELTRPDSNPGEWTVRHATRLMWFKKRVSSHCFQDEQQALAYADELKLRFIPRLTA